VVAEPALPMPERPHILFLQDPVTKQVCITPQEADELLKWVKKLNEFEQARAKALQVQP
jgi:hypothetical protein